MPTLSRQWSLVRRPIGEPSLDDFSVLVARLGDPAPGEVLVRNEWISVDPYMRGRMNDGDSYIAPFDIGAPMTGSAVASVVASAVPELPVGTRVTHFAGWREYALLPAGAVQVLGATEVAPELYLGILGSTGLTAYAGLKEVAQVRDGETVFVSGAAGAVGSAAGQIARALGAGRVIGSAGGPEKARRLIEDFKFDAALDYRAGTLTDQLREAAPEGIDVYFDNVGGQHLEAALDVMNRGGRVVLCGAVAGYNATTPIPGPRNLALAIGKRIRLEGMIVGDYNHLAEEYREFAVGLLRTGELRSEQTVVEGIESAPAAFLGMMRGENLGKMLVHLPSEPNEGEVR